MRSECIRTTLFKHAMKKIESSQPHTSSKENQSKSSQLHNGSISTLLIGGDNTTSTYSSKDIEPIEELITDDLSNLKTNSILYGSKITDYYIHISMKVMKHLAESPFKGNSDIQRKIIDYAHKIMKCDDITFDILKQKFHATSNECLFAYFVRGYLSSPNDLVLSWMYTVGRVLPMTRRDEWFDNFRLSAYGACFNMVVWDKFNSEDSYAVDYNPIDIVKSKSINNIRFNEKLVGPFRKFLLGQHLLPHEYKDNKPTEHFDDSTLSDTAYLHFPFYFGGAHGCDVFDIPDKSLSVVEIKDVLQRYPSALIGYILNTSTYRSGKGEHWVAVIFSNFDGLQCNLICSQKSNFDVFRDDGRFKQTLSTLGFKMNHNSIETQRNNYSCGELSVLSLLKMIEYRNINDAVFNIGLNAENFGNELGKQTNINKIREKIVGTL